jgi:Domain of unknown function (DUF4412)
MRRVVLLVLTLVHATVLVPGAFGQGLVVVLNQTGSGPAPTQPTMQLTETRGRFDAPGLGQVFYNAQNKTMRVIPAILKAYLEYTPQSVQQLVAAGRGVAPQPRLTYRRTGTSTVKQWPCTLYEGTRGAQKLIELCVAQGKGLPLTVADFAIVQEALDLAAPFTAQDALARIPVYGTTAKHGYAGFPVRHTFFRAGQPPIVTELVEVRREAVPPASLEVPPGYSKAGQ